MVRANQWADIRCGVVTRTETQLFGFFEAERGESLADGLFNKEAFDGEANLTAIRVAAPDGRAGSDVEIGVRKNDHGIFAAEFQHAGDEFFGAGFRDAAAGGDTAGEQDLLRGGFD